jgi:hypothetical protein
MALTIHSNAPTKKIEMTDKHMRFVKKYLPHDVTIVEQKAGNVVQPAVGAAHAVWNMKACLKMAFDRVTHNDAAAAVLSREVVAIPYFRQNMPRDYSSVVRKVANNVWSVVKEE